MKAPLYDLLVSLIRHTIRDLWQIEYPDAEIALDLPTDKRFGDLSTSVALRLSKQLKKNPRDIAQSLSQALQTKFGDEQLCGFIKEVKVEGAGFINFYLQDAYFYSQLQGFIQKGRDVFSGRHSRARRVLLEFVSANPTGPLSVAHARQAAVGDSLANILAFLGFQVSREYYLNDEGNQINILGESVRLRQKQLAGEAVEFPENCYQGDYIYDIARAFAQVAVNRDAGEYAAEIILQGIEKELADFGVSFDCWYSQKALGKSGKVEEALSALRSAGHIYDEGGAVWFRSSAFGDDKDRVVIKSDGAYTYLAPDIAYHKEKYDRGYDWLINFWGPDHHGYISRIKAAVSAQGYPPDSLSIVIVQLATIFRDGKVVEMSTRKGQYITLQEVLSEVGRDAARFFFLMRRTNSHLDFDLEVAKKQTAENPVYYVQYAHARICSILRNSAPELISGADVRLLKEKEELSLVRKIFQLRSVLDICLYTCDPYMLTVYLQGLAESFHKFYDLHRVLGDDQALTAARLALIACTKTALAVGLELLGVSAPEQM